MFKYFSWRNLLVLLVLVVVLWYVYTYQDAVAAEITKFKQAFLGWL